VAWFCGVRRLVDMRQCGCDRPRVLMQADTIMDFGDFKMQPYRVERCR
jgi:hypothetical protein